MAIKENTFAEACYNTNSIEELQAALAAPADVTDMKQWGLSEDEYFKQIQLAIDELAEDHQ